MADMIEIFRYPIKGLSEQPLDQTDLIANQILPRDRAYAIALDGTKFDPSAPRYVPKLSFLMLMRDIKLAELKVKFNNDASALSIYRRGDLELEANLEEDAGRSALEAYMANFAPEGQGENLKVLNVPGHMFADYPDQYVSILNLASVAGLSDHLKTQIDPLRFRANFHVDGLDAWEEKKWEPGDLLEIGGATLKFEQHIVRCAATNVNLETAEIDFNLPQVLLRDFDANHMGVYARVMKPGTVKRGDPLKNIGQ